MRITMVGHSFQNYDRIFASFSAAYSCLRTLRMGFKHIYIVTYLRKLKLKAEMCEINVQIYATYKDPHQVRVLKCAYMP